MDAVQVMRRRAQQAGNLKSTPQQTVEMQGSTVVIQPATPEVVYVPAYDPWVVYGDPIVAWPGWYPYPGIWDDGPFLGWGIGFEIGWFAGWGWGWGHWGFDWHHRYSTFDHDRYYSHNCIFYNRDHFYRGGERGGGERGGVGGQWFRSFRSGGQALQRRLPRCPRIRGTPGRERYEIGCLQRLRSWRRGTGLFLTWELQLRRRRARWWLRRRRT